MGCYRCLGHQPPELQEGNLPAFLRHFTEASPLFVGPPRNSESIPSSVRRLDDKNGSAHKEIYLVCICTTLANLLSILNALTHLITLLLYSGHQFMYNMVVMSVQYNVKLPENCVVFELVC